MAEQENKSPLIPSTPTTSPLGWMQEARPADAHKTCSLERGARDIESVKNMLRLTQNLSSYLADALGKMNADGKFDSPLHACVKAHKDCLKLSEQQSIRHEPSPSATLKPRG